jgi:acylphosphatase
MIKAAKIKVTGRVQRVGYRRFVLEVAQELGLKGFVKNMLDGSVSIFVQGEEKLINDFVNAIREVKEPVRVKSIDVKEAKVNAKIKRFEVKYGKLAEELQEGFGSMQSIFMDYWKEFKDYREEFKDFRSEFRDYRQEFREFRNEFKEFAQRTDNNFKLISEKYEEISNKLTNILNEFREESKRTREILEELRKDSKETREQLAKAIGMLADAIDKLR